MRITRHDAPMQILPARKDDLRTTGDELRDDGDGLVATAQRRFHEWARNAYRLEGNDSPTLMTKKG